MHIFASCSCAAGEFRRDWGEGGGINSERAFTDYRNRNAKNRQYARVFILFTKYGNILNIIVGTILLNYQFSSVIFGDVFVKKSHKSLFTVKLSR